MSFKYALFVTGASITAILDTSRSCASMLLLAAELLSIPVCAGPAKSELGPVDIIAGLVLGRLYGAVRASAAM